MFKSVVHLTIAVAAVAAADSALAQTYQFTSLSLPGGVSISANAINNHGQAVGSAYGDSSTKQAVMWNSTEPVILGGLGGASSEALAINLLGQSVGYSFDMGFTQQAVLWDGTTPTVLNHPTGSGALSAVGINDRGQVAGNVATYFGGPSQAVRWSRNNPVLLDNKGGHDSFASGINNSGDVVGYIDGANGSNNRDPVIWHGKEATVLGSLTEVICCNQASAINNRGQVVGWSSSGTSGTVRAVVWNGDRPPRALQSLSDADRALAINNQGQAVGALNTGGSSRAALWDLSNGRGVDINTFLSAVEIQAGWVLYSAQGINDSGAIVGVAFNKNTGNFSGFELSPVPEPDAVVMSFSPLTLK